MGGITADWPVIRVQQSRRVIDLEDVIDVEVEDVDPDNRTQAERNADNAIKAARLARVEAELNDALGKLSAIEEKGGMRVSTSSLRTVLERCLAAPIEG